MKKIIALLLTLAMLLSLAACGGSAEEDPNAGKYIGISAAVGGFTMPMSDVYEGETWIELKSGGKGNIMLDGDSFSLKWVLEGEAITITLEDVDSVGTLKNGTIVMDLMNMGCVMTFQKEGTEPAATEAPAASYNDAGYWDLIRIDGATEEDSISEEDMAMAKEMGMYMYLELLPDGTGTFFMEEEMAVTWVDGTVNFTEDNMSINYALENGELILDMLESVLVFRLGNQDTAESDDSTITGSYSLYALEDSGEYIDNATLVSLEMDGAVIITFNGDGTGVMSTEGEEVTFTYDDTTMSDADGFTYAYTFEDGMLKVDVGNGQIFHCQKN